MVLDLGGSGPARPGPAVGPDRTRGRVRRSDPDSAGAAGTGLLYERVVALVEQLIVDRGLAPGDLLPSHAELAELGGVSLITVRRALDELERAGRVRRHQGLGTFVARPRIVSEPTRTGSLLGTLGTLGAESGLPARLETRVLELRPGEPSGYLRDALGLQPGQHVWRLRRLRLLDGAPAVLESSVIPIALAPELDQLAGRLTGSLYDLLASEYGLSDAFEEQYLEVIGPTKEEAVLLNIRARAQAVRIRGLSASAAGVSFDCFEQLYPADQFAFAISGSALRRLLPVPGHLDWSVT
jgi:DNA-binding GntR family transcriptional regulator